MKIYITTRFNMRWKAIDNYEKWLENRFYLVENFYLKSLHSQKNKNFECVFLVDEKTKIESIERLKSLFNAYKVKLNLIYTSGVSDFKKKIHNFLKDKECIVSRIDSDDYVSPDYTKNISNFFCEDKNKNYIFDYKRIYYFDVNKNNIVLADYNASTMFISMIYKKFTPYDFPHDLAPKKTGMKIFKSEKNDVICVCHESNITNNLSKAKRRFKYEKINNIPWYKK